jgi:hypothetical protein
MKEIGAEKTAGENATKIMPTYTNIGGVEYPNYENTKEGMFTIINGKHIPAGTIPGATLMGKPGSDNAANISYAISLADKQQKMYLGNAMDIQKSLITKLVKQDVIKGKDLDDVWNNNKGELRPGSYSTLLTWMNQSIPMVRNGKTKIDPNTNQLIQESRLNSLIFGKEKLFPGDTGSDGKTWKPTPAQTDLTSEGTLFKYNNDKKNEADAALGNLTVETDKSRFQGVDPKVTNLYKNVRNLFGNPDLTPDQVTYLEKQMGGRDPRSLNGKDFDDLDQNKQIEIMTTMSKSSTSKSK